VQTLVYTLTNVYEKVYENMICDKNFTSRSLVETLTSFDWKHLYFGWIIYSNEIAFVLYCSISSHNV
jgi:hypothetical protein